MLFDFLKKTTKTNDIASCEIDSVKSDIIYLKKLTESLNEKDEKILKAKKEWENTFDSVPDPLVIVDKNGIITHTNNAAESLFALICNELTNLSVSTFLNNLKLDHTCELINQDIKNTSDLFKEVFYTKKSKEKSFNLETLNLYYIITASPLLIDDEVSSIVFLFKDVSKLYKTKNRLESVLNASESGYWDWYPQHNQFYGSDRFYEILNINKNNFSFSYVKLHEYIKKYIFVEDQELVTKSIDKALNPEETYVDITFRLYDGSHFKWVQVRGNVSYYDTTAKETLRISGILLDVSEKKKIELEKEEKDNLLKQLTDTMTDLLWAKDLQGKFIFCNKADLDKLLDPDRNFSEHLGKTDLEFARKQRKIGKEKGIKDYHTFGELCQDSDKITLSEMKPSRFFEDGNVKGKYLALDVIKAPLYNKSGTLIGTVGCGRDITEEVQIKNTLDRKNRLLEAITEVSRVLAETDNWDDAINSLLKILGESTGVDRTYIFQNEQYKSGTYCSLIHEWTKENVSSFFEDDILCLGYSEIPRWKEFFENKHIICGNIKDFPEDEQILLKNKNISSICAVPIFSRDKWWGFIGFDESISNRAWTYDEEKLLYTVSIILGGFIYQRDMYHCAKKRCKHLTTKEVRNEIISI